MTTRNNNSVLLRKGRSIALMVAVTLACTASFAEKPEWAGGGKGDKGGKHEQKASHNQNSHNTHENQRNNPPGAHGPSGQKSGHGNGNGARANPVRVGAYFGDQQRGVVRTYYGNEFKAGRCPPGLAKKNNGCMPPGQAKKYHVGQRLPGNVTYYQVPQNVIYQLGAPPSGHRYVRVGSDVLLLAIGTGMVVDAIQNLSGY